MKPQKKLQSKSPYNGEVRKQFKYTTSEELTNKIKKAEKAFKIQNERTLQERAKIVAKMAKIFKDHKDQLAQLITFQMGKPIKQAQGQVQKTISFFQYFSQHTQPLKPRLIQETGAKIKAQILYKPLGTIYVIVPFNFPLQSGFKGGIAALLAGNCLLVKTTSSCPALAQLIQKLVIQAGFDSGQYQCVHATHQMVDQILQNDSVAGVSFTGSTKAGKKIASKAGEYLKKSVMELGGNDPFVILKDADFDLALQKAISGRTRNGGQTCTSPKRFIIEEQFYDKFRDSLIQKLKKIKYGDPMEKDTQLGPLAKQNLYDNLKDQISSLPKSYKVIWQRQDVQKPFFPITVIQGSDEVYDQEMFGPTYILYRAKDQKHAIQLANTGSYGLGGSVFSKSHGQEVINQIRCGMGFVNQIVKSGFLLPSGGVAKSGYGRQCGEQGYFQFTNIKVHYIC